MKEMEGWRALAVTSSREDTASTTLVAAAAILVPSPAAAIQPLGGGGTIHHTTSTEGEGELSYYRLYIVHTVRGVKRGRWGGGVLIKGSMRLYTVQSCI